MGDVVVFIGKTLHKRTKIICKKNMPLIIAITIGRLNLKEKRKNLLGIRPLIFIVSN